MAVTTTIRTGPRSTELDGLDKAIEFHPIWTELRGPVIKSLSYTSQLQDFYQYSQSTGRKMDLVIRGDTVLSKQLQQMEYNHQINVFRMIA